jgi:hypothetical protein
MLMAASFKCLFLKDNDFTFSIFIFPSKKIGPMVSDSWLKN